MPEITEKISEQIENAERSKLNSLIAILVSISASLMAIYNIKDNNVVQAMSQAQAHNIDSWSYYQAKSTKKNLVENYLSQLQLQAVLNRANASTEKVIEEHITDAKARISKYDQEMAQIKVQAEGYQKEYDGLNLHDDQFDLAEALISLGLSIFGITALTQKKSLFYFGTALSGLGIFFGLAGFLGWSVHPEWLTRLLG